MSDPKSTNDIRLIAQGVAHQQAEVCEARRDNLTDKLAALTVTVNANAVAITTLTANIAILTAAIWAAIGAGVPVLLAVLLWWLSK
jgi:hypothetical protein